MLLSEVYKGKIVHIIGAPTEYLGIIDNHPMCKKDYNGWLRIKNPCFIGQIQIKNTAKIETKIVKYGMPSGDYELYVDAYIPDFALELRPLDPEGGSYAAYQNQMGKEFTRGGVIVTPDSEQIAKFKGQGSKEKIRRIQQNRKH